MCSGDSAVPVEATPASNRATVYPLSQRRVPIDLNMQVIKHPHRIAQASWLPLDLLGHCIDWLVSGDDRYLALVQECYCVTNLIHHMFDCAREWGWSRRRGSRAVMLTSKLMWHFISWMCGGLTMCQLLHHPLLQWRRLSPATHTPVPAVASANQYQARPALQLWEGRYSFFWRMQGGYW